MYPKMFFLLSLSDKNDLYSSNELWSDRLFSTNHVQRAGTTNDSTAKHVQQLWMNKKNHWIGWHYFTLTERQLDKNIPILPFAVTAYTAKTATKGSG